MVFSDFPLKLSLLWILSQLYKYNYLNGLFVFLTTISKTNFKDIKKNIVYKFKLKYRECIWIRVLKVFVEIQVYNNYFFWLLKEKL